jgi:hypothetical protein
MGDRLPSYSGATSNVARASAARLYVRPWNERRVLTMSVEGPYSTMRTLMLALVALSLEGCFLELKAGYAYVKQTSPSSQPTSDGHGVTIGFSIGTFIDPMKVKTMVAVHYPFFNVQTNQSGLPVYYYSDNAWGLRLDRDISGYKTTFGLPSKRRLTLALQRGSGGRFDHSFDPTNNTNCPSGSNVRGDTCMQSATGSTQFKAYAGYTMQMGIPGDMFGEGLGLSVGPSYAHWGGDGPAGHMDAYGVEVRIHAAVLWKMIGGTPKQSFWDTYTPPKGDTPLPEPEQPKIPSNDRTKNPTCTGPNCF